MSLGRVLVSDYETDLELIYTRADIFPYPVISSYRALSLTHSSTLTLAGPLALKYNLKDPSTYKALTSANTGTPTDTDHCYLHRQQHV